MSLQNRGFQVRVLAALTSEGPGNGAFSLSPHSRSICRNGSLVTLFGNRSPEVHRSLADKHSDARRPLSPVGALPTAQAASCVRAGRAPFVPLTHALTTEAGSPAEQDDRGSDLGSSRSVTRLGKPATGDGRKATRCCFPYCSSCCWPLCQECAGLNRQGR